MANNPELLKMPLARDGQKNTIPETATASAGIFSQQYGWQSINALPPQAGGKAVKREDFNGAFNLLGGIAFMAQKGFTFKWSDEQDYYAGCVVIDDTDGLRYECIADVAANSTAPSADATHWQIFNSGGSGIDSWFRQPNTQYGNGAIALLSMLPTGWYLECTGTGGITSADDLVITSPTVGATVTDGAVVWTIRSISAEATTTDKGLLSPSDKSKIDNIPASGGTGFNHREVITTSGTWTAPTSGYYKVTCIGGGGAGGNGGSSSKGGLTGTRGGTTSFGSLSANGGHSGGAGGSYAGGGGGAAGEVTVDFVALNANDSVNVAVGAGGVAHTSGYSDSAVGQSGSGGASGGVASGGGQGAISAYGSGNAGSPYYSQGAGYGAMPVGVGGNNGTIYGGGGGGGSTNHSNQLPRYGAVGGANGSAANTITTVDSTYPKGGNGGNGAIIIEYFLAD